MLILNINKKNYIYKKNKNDLICNPSVKIKEKIDVNYTYK